MGSATLIEKLGELRNRARAGLMGMARKEASGGKPEPAEKLLETLTTAGLSPEKYDELLGLHREHEELKRAAAGLDAAGAKVAGLRRKLHEHQRETEKLVTPRREAERKLVGEIREAAEALDEMQAAVGRLQAYEVAHGRDLGLEALDLDRFSLVHGDPHPRSGKAILPGPEGAPVLHVPSEVFQREAAKRHRILVAARLKLARAHGEELIAWGERQRRTYGGDRVDNPRDPRPAEPAEVTWDDIVSKRVEVTDRDLAHEDVRSALGERETR